MKQLIDFDEQFNEYMDAWAEKLLSDGKKPEEIESLIPQAYEDWSKEASKYFDGLPSDELCQMLSAYLDEEISVPDVLIEKIVSDKDCEKGVYNLFTQERSDNDKIMLMNILVDMNSALPINDYISMLCYDENADLADAAAEALKYASGVATEKVLEIYEEERDTETKEKLMYVLVYTEPKVEGLGSKLIALMNETENKALIAGMMAFYGDDSCLNALKNAENAEGINYIDYVEICDAIEALGGETDRKREFDGDEYYEMIHSGGLDQ